MDHIVLDVFTVAKIVGLLAVVGALGTGILCMRARTKPQNERENSQRSENKTRYLLKLIFCMFIIFAMANLSSAPLADASRAVLLSMLLLIVSSAAAIYALRERSKRSEDKSSGGGSN
jgi:cytochrome bd-type quinol oxidase subunit 2